LLAKAHVKRADDEEGEGDAQVDEVVHGVSGLKANENGTGDEGSHCETEEEEIVHGVLGRLSKAKVHAPPILPS
jgi:hypothetical protein